MSSPLEFDGKNVDAAVLLACKKLDVQKKELKYDVISYGATGIFGLVGAKKARIKVFPQKSKNSPIPDEVEDNRDIVSNKYSNDSNNKPEIKETASEDNEQILSDLSDSHDNDNIDDNIDDNMDKSGAEGIVPDLKVHTFDTDPVILGTDALQRIINFITTDAKVTVNQKPNEILFNIEGGNTAILIGKRGKNLEAIQYLVEKIINKHYRPKVRILIDIEGYLKTKQDNLVALAERIAKKAVLANKPLSIGKLNSYDRRTVHIALKNNKSIKTISIGRNYYRRLVIFPQKEKSVNEQSEG